MFQVGIQGTLRLKSMSLTCEQLDTRVKCFLHSLWLEQATSKGAVTQKREEGKVITMKSLGTRAFLLQKTDQHSPFQKRPNISIF